MRPWIHVLAGVNGAGKSSVAGAMFRRAGISFYNPDDYAREMVQRGMADLASANIEAWSYGREQLERAMENGLDFAFETTLGGNTITRLLGTAAKSHDVHVTFVGLASVDLHLARVAQRVASGGHPIPEAKIRERWDASRRNICTLVPDLASLTVFDNSATVQPGMPVARPKLVLNLRNRCVIHPDRTNLTELAAVPDWAKPIVEAALSLTD